MSGALTADRLREGLRYNAESGLFFWRRPPKNHARLNEYVAGGIATGYVVIRIDGKKYKAHRLAWLYTHGKWPVDCLDHANGCPLDNRMSNLRPATNPQNQANRLRDHDKTTPKGVRLLSSGRFMARITVDKKQICLGSYATAEEAQAAYMEAAKRHYDEFARAA